jgi:diguanylate cyclase (GGDEF)-like protein/PAS domain S-box-containing protein
MLCWPLKKTGKVARLMDSLFEFLPIGAYRTSADGRLERANASWVRMNGYETEAEMLAAIDRVAEAWYVDPQRHLAFMAQMQAQGFVVNFVSEIYRHKTRERIWIREAAHAVSDDQGGILYYEGTVEDITESYKTLLSLEQSEERWKLAMDSSGDGVWDWHVQNGDEFFSKSCKAIYGFEEHEIANRSEALDGRTHLDDVVQMQRDREDHFSGKTPVYRNEHRILCKDNTWKWVLSRGVVIARDADGKPLRMIGTHSDITERKTAEAQIWRQANFDQLTGLPNRRMLRTRLEEALSRSKSVDSKLAVVFVDLDHFKEVNDTLGHEAGDLLLVEASKRIQKSLGGTDTVARMGGDEFTLVINHVTEPAALEIQLQGILDKMALAFPIRTEQVFVSASLGVALFPDDATTVEDLFKHADQALYVAKGAGRNRYAFFTPALEEAAQNRLRLAADLRGALAGNEFEVVYQPIVNLATGQVAKAEALLRWHNPQRGLVSPAQFISIAESTGMIIDIGEWVFQQAAAQVAQWQKRYDPHFQISVNKSPVQFHYRGGQASWAEQLHAVGLDGNSISVEITEGVLLESGAAVAQQLAALRAGGCAISLDDFGTGYSSLTYLQRFAIDVIKIDQSFVRNLATRSTDLALCRAIIVMAHELGLTVVAEGVETEEQRDLLIGIGCDYGQGYWFAKPLGARAFELFMAARAEASKAAF